MRLRLNALGILEILALVLLLVLSLCIVLASTDEIKLRSHFNKALDLASADEYEAALEELTACMKAKAEYPYPYEVAAKLLIERKGTAKQKERFEEAKKLYERMQRVTPRHPQANMHIGLGVMALKAGQRPDGTYSKDALASARKEFEKAAKLAPRQADAYINLGTLSLLEYDLARAASNREGRLASLIAADASFEQARKADSISRNGQSRLHEGLGFLYVRKGKGATAVTYLENATQLDGSRVGAKINLGIACAVKLTTTKLDIHQRSEYVQKAENILYKHLEGKRDPSLCAMYNALGVGMAMDGKNCDRARKLFERAAQLPRAQGIALVNRAIVRYHDEKGRGRLERAETKAQIAKELKGALDHPEARWVPAATRGQALGLLGSLLRLGNRPGEASDYLMQAEKLVPEDALVLRNLGALFYEAKDFQKAVHYYEESLRLNPKQPDVKTSHDQLQGKPVIGPISRSEGFTIPLREPRAEPIFVTTVTSSSSPQPLSENHVKAHFGDKQGAVVFNGDDVIILSPGPLSPGSHSLRVAVKDPMGNTAEKSFAFSIDVNP